MTDDINARLVDWLTSGDTGTSSEAIALWLARGRKGRWGADTPSDPSDLGRCLRLLDKFPEFRARFAEMADAGGHWPTFVERWPEFEATFLEECGGRLLAKGEGRGIECPRTYHLMKLAEADSYERRGFEVGRREDGTVTYAVLREPSHA